MAFAIVTCLDFNYGHQNYDKMVFPESISLDNDCSVVRRCFNGGRNFPLSPTPYAQCHCICPPPYTGMFCHIKVTTITVRVRKPKLKKQVEKRASFEESKEEPDVIQLHSDRDNNDDLDLPSYTSDTSMPLLNDDILRRSSRRVRNLINQLLRS